MSDNKITPKTKERYIILDALRGFALFGICLANYSELSLYSFQSSGTIAAMPTAEIDKIVRYLQYIFIDGKFYTIFSILFGIGFSIILSNAEKNNRNGLKIFYRRMVILFFIGLFHLVFLWAGDILILYAFAGFFLPLFRNLSNRKLLTWALALLLIPVVIDGVIVLSGINLAAPVIHVTQHFHRLVGINDHNFPVWLAEKQTYADIVRFNLGGSFIRMQEFIEGNRFFKVFGLFLFGLYIGRNKLYAKLEHYKTQLKKICLPLLVIIGLPYTFLYAWSAMNGQPLGPVIHSLLYAFSVVPLSLAYITVFCLLYLKWKEGRFFTLMAYPGRMALTNYIMQSVFGILIFYGVGFGLGASTGLVYVELIALGIFIFQIVYSKLWLRYFNFGPLEWIWRILTYGKWIKLKNKHGLY